MPWLKGIAAVTVFIFTFTSILPAGYAQQPPAPAVEKEHLRGQAIVENDKAKTGLEERLFGGTIQAGAEESWGRWGAVAMVLFGMGILGAARADLSASQVPPTLPIGSQVAQGEKKKESALASLREKLGPEGDLSIIVWDPVPLLDANRKEFFADMVKAKFDTVWISGYGFRKKLNAQQRQEIVTMAEEAGLTRLGFMDGNDDWPQQKGFVDEHFRDLTAIVSRLKRDKLRLKFAFALDIEEYTRKDWGGDVGPKMRLVRDTILPHLRKVKDADVIKMVHPWWLENGRKTDSGVVVEGLLAIPGTNGVSAMTYGKTGREIAKFAEIVGKQAEASKQDFGVGVETLASQGVPALRADEIGPVLEEALDLIRERTYGKNLKRVFVHTKGVPEAHDIAVKQMRVVDPKKPPPEPAKEFGVQNNKATRLAEGELALQLQLTKEMAGQDLVAIPYIHIKNDIWYIQPSPDSDAIFPVKDGRVTITLSKEVAKRSPLLGGQTDRRMVLIMPRGQAEAAVKATPQAAGKMASRIIVIDNEGGTKIVGEVPRAGLEERTSLWEQRTAAVSAGAEESDKLSRRTFLKATAATVGAAALATVPGEVQAQPPPVPPAGAGPVTYYDTKLGWVDRPNYFVADFDSGDFFPPKPRKIFAPRGIRAVHSAAETFVNRWDKWLSGLGKLTAKLAGWEKGPPGLSEVVNDWQPGNVGELPGLRSYVLWAPWLVEDESWWPAIFEGMRKSAGIGPHETSGGDHSRIYLDPYGVISPFRPWEVDGLVRFINEAGKHGVQVVPLLGDPSQADYPTAAIYLMRSLISTQAIAPDAKGVIRFAFDIEANGLDEYEELKAEIDALKKEVETNPGKREELLRKQREFDRKQKQWWENIFLIGTDTQEKLFSGFKAQSMKEKFSGVEVSFFVPPDFFDLAKRMRIKVPPGVHLKVMAYSNQVKGTREKPGIVDYADEVRKAFLEDAREPDPNKRLFEGVTYSIAVDIGAHQDIKNTLWRDSNGGYTGRVGDRTQEVGNELDKLLGRPPGLFSRGQRGWDGERILHTHSFEDLVWFLKEGGPASNVAASHEMQQYLKRGLRIVKEMAKFISAHVREDESVSYRAFVNGVPVSKKGVSYLRKLSQRIISGSVGTGAMLASLKSIRDTMVRTALSIDRNAYLFGSDIGIVHSGIGIAHSKNYGQEARMNWMSRTVVDPAAIGLPVALNPGEKAKVVRLLERYVNEQGEEYAAGTLLVEGTVLPRSVPVERGVTVTGDAGRTVQVLGTRLRGKTQVRGEGSEYVDLIPGRAISDKDNLLGDGRSKDGKKKDGSDPQRKKNDLEGTQLPTAAYDLYWTVEVSNLSASEALSAFIQMRPHAGFGEAHDVQTDPFDLAPGQSGTYTLKLRIGHDDYDKPVEGAEQQRSNTDSFDRMSRLLHNLPLAEAAFLISHKGSTNKWGEIAHAVGVVNFDPKALNYTLRDRRYETELEDAVKETIEQERPSEFSLRSLDWEMGMSVSMPAQAGPGPVDLEEPRRLMQSVARRRHAHGVTRVMLQSGDLLRLVRRTLEERRDSGLQQDQMELFFQEMTQSREWQRLLRFFHEAHEENVHLGLVVKVQDIAAALKGLEPRDAARDPQMTQEFFNSLALLLEQPVLRLKMDFLAVAGHDQIERETGLPRITRTFLNAQDFSTPLLFLGRTAGMTDVRDLEQNVTYQVPQAQDLTGLPHEEVNRFLSRRRDESATGWVFLTPEQYERGRALTQADSGEIIRKLVGEFPRDPQLHYSEGGKVTPRWLWEQTEIPRGYLSVFSRMIRDTLELSTVSSLTTGDNDPQAERWIHDPTHVYYYRLRVFDLDGNLLKSQEFMTNPLQFDLREGAPPIRGMIRGLKPGHRYSISLELAPGTFKREIPGHSLSTPKVKVEGRRDFLEVNPGQKNWLMVGPRRLDFGYENLVQKEVNGVTELIPEHWTVKTEQGQLLHVGHSAGLDRLIWWAGDGPAQALSVPAGRNSASVDTRLGEVPVRIQLGDQASGSPVSLKVEDETMRLWDRLDLRLAHRAQTMVPVEIPPAAEGEPPLRSIEVTARFDTGGLGFQLLPVNAPLPALASELPTEVEDTTEKQITPHSLTSQYAGEGLALLSAAVPAGALARGASNQYWKARTKFRDDRIRWQQEEQQKQAARRAARRAEARRESAPPAKAKEAATSAPVDLESRIRTGVWVTVSTLIAGALLWLIPAVPVLLGEGFIGGTLMETGWGVGVKLVALALVGGMGAALWRAISPRSYETVHTATLPALGSNPASGIVRWIISEGFSLPEIFRRANTLLRYTIFAVAIYLFHGPVIAALGAIAEINLFSWGPLAALVAVEPTVLLTVGSLVVGALLLWMGWRIYQNWNREESLRVNLLSAVRASAKPFFVAGILAAMIYFFWPGSIALITVGQLFKAAGIFYLGSNLGYLLFGNLLPAAGGGILFMSIPAILGYQGSNRFAASDLPTPDGAWISREGAQRVKEIGVLTAILAAGAFWLIGSWIAPAVIVALAIPSAIFAIRNPSTPGPTDGSPTPNTAWARNVAWGLDWLVNRTPVAAAAGAGGVWFLYALPEILSSMGSLGVVIGEVLTAIYGAPATGLILATVSAFILILLAGRVAVRRVANWWRGPVEPFQQWFRKKAKSDAVVLQMGLPDDPNAARNTQTLAQKHYLPAVDDLKQDGQITHEQAKELRRKIREEAGLPAPPTPAGLEEAKKLKEDQLHALLEKRIVFRLAWERAEKILGGPAGLQALIQRSRDEADNALRDNAVVWEAIELIKAIGIQKLRDQAILAKDKNAQDTLDALEKGGWLENARAQKTLGDVVVELDQLANILNKTQNKKPRWSASDVSTGKAMSTRLTGSTAKIRAPEDLLTGLAFSFEQTNVILQMDVGAKFAHEPFPGDEQTTPPWFALHLSEIINYLRGSNAQAVFPGIFVFPSFDVNHFDNGLQAFGTPIIFFSQAMNYTPSMTVRVALSMAEGSQPRLAIGFVRSDMEPDMMAFASQVQGRWGQHKYVFTFAELTGRRFVWDPDTLKPRSFERLPGPIHAIMKLLQKSKDAGANLAAQYDQVPTLTNLWYQVGEMPPFDGFRVLRWNDETDDPNTNISDEEALGGYHPDPGVKVIRLHGRRSFNDSWLHGSVAVEVRRDNGKAQIAGRPSKFEFRFGPDTLQNPKSARMGLALAILHGIYTVEPQVDTTTGTVEFKTWTPASEAPAKEVMKKREEVLKDQKKKGEVARKANLETGPRVDTKGETTAAGAEEDSAWVKENGGLDMGRDHLGFAVSDSRKGAFRQFLYRLADWITLRYWAFDNSPQREPDAKPNLLNRLLGAVAGGVAGAAAGWGFTALWDAGLTGIVVGGVLGAVSGLFVGLFVGLTATRFLRDRFKAALLGGLTGAAVGFAFTFMGDGGLTGALIGGGIGAVYGLIAGLTSTARLWYRVSLPMWLGIYLFVKGAIGWPVFIGLLLLSRFFQNPIFRDLIPISFWGFRTDPLISAFRYDYDPKHVVNLVKRATGALGEIPEEDTAGSQADFLKKGWEVLQKLPDLYQWTLDLARGLSPDRWDENPSWSEADWENLFVRLIGGRKFLGFKLTQGAFDQVPEKDRVAVQYAILAIVQGHRAAAGQDPALISELFYGSHDSGVQRLGDVNRVMTWFREHNGQVAPHQNLPNLMGTAPRRQVNQRLRSWAWTAHPSAVGGIRISGGFFYLNAAGDLLFDYDAPVRRLAFRMSNNLERVYITEQGGRRRLVLVGPALGKGLKNMDAAEREKTLTQLFEWAQIDLERDFGVEGIGSVDVVEKEGEVPAEGRQLLARRTDNLIEAYLGSGSTDTFTDWLLITQSRLQPDTDTLVQTRAGQARTAIQGPRVVLADPKSQLNGAPGLRIFGITIPFISAEYWYSGMFRPTGTPGRFPVIDSLLYHASHILDNLGGITSRLLGLKGTTAWAVEGMGNFIGRVINRAAGFVGAAALIGGGLWGYFNALAVGSIIVPFIVPVLVGLIVAVLGTAAVLQIGYSGYSLFNNQRRESLSERITGVILGLGLLAAAVAALVFLPLLLGAVPIAAATMVGFIAVGAMLLLGIYVMVNVFHSTDGMDGFRLDNWVDRQEGFWAGGDGIRALSLIPGVVSWIFSQLLFRLVFRILDNVVPTPFPNFSWDAHMLARDLNDTPEMFQGLVHNVSYPRWFGSFPPGLPALKIVMWMASFWWDTTPVPATVALRLANETPGFREISEANYGSSGKMGREAIPLIALAEDTRLNETMLLNPPGFPSSPADSLWLEEKLLFEYLRMRDSDDDLLHRGVLFGKGMSMEQSNSRLRRGREAEQILGEMDQMTPADQIAFLTSMEGYLQAMSRNEVAVGGRSGAVGIYSYLFTAFTASPLYFRLIGMYAPGELEGLLWFTLFAWLDRSMGGALARQMEQMQIDRGFLQGPRQLTQRPVPLPEGRPPTPEELRAWNQGTLFDSNVRARLLAGQFVDPRVALAAVWLAEANEQARADHLGREPDPEAIQPLADSEDMVYTQSRHIPDLKVVTLHGVRLWPLDIGGRESKVTDAHPHLRSINRILHANGKTELIMLSQDALDQLAQIVEARPLGSPVHTQPLVPPAAAKKVAGEPEAPVMLEETPAPATDQPVSQAGLEEPVVTRTAFVSPVSQSVPITDRLAGMSPEEVRGLMEQLREGSTRPDVDTAIAMQTIRSDVKARAAQAAEEVVRAAGGVYVEANVSAPAVFLFDDSTTWVLAPQVARAGARVAMLVDQISVAAGMEELFRRAQIPQGQYAVVSVEAFGGDADAALKTLQSRFPPGVSFVQVPARTGLEEVERFLRDHGVILYTEAAAGAEQVDRYIASLT